VGRKQWWPGRDVPIYVAAGLEEFVMMGEAVAATIFVIDDDEPMRMAITNLLDSVGLIVETFASPHEFLDKQGRIDGPGCLILDVRLRGASGLDFQRELVKADAKTPIIFITGHGDIPMSVQAMKAGAVDFLTKPFRDQELLDAIQEALKRDAATRAEQREVVSVHEQFDKLTAREREVMTLVASGLLNKQIADKLGTSETTAKVHRGNVMRKMRVQSLAGLIRAAQKLSLR
jgi:FixJ family two-component response regulator